MLNNIAMIDITTSNSMSVNARIFFSILISIFL